MLKDKTIVLGVTGSIAAYKIANLASMLVRQHADVHVIMTRNACNFINPITFETLTHNKCLVDTFDRNFEFKVEHVSLAQKADLFLIAPATANVIGKMASGICDDMLTTTVCATKKPVLISPAMNTGMFENPIVQDNLEKLRRFGYHVIDPDTGHLACGDNGKGRMPSEELLMQYIEMFIPYEQDLKNRHILITAGPTQEAIDPVRYITNHSSGKMGYALANAACTRGARVTLVSGPVSNEVKALPFVDVIYVRSAKEMFDATIAHSTRCDTFIGCAAVADYTPASYHDQKVKKSDGDLSLELTRTNDIIGYLGQHRGNISTIIGFSMETENLIENSTKKLEKKNIDFICANTIAVAETGQNTTGFGVNTNQVTIIGHNGYVNKLPLCSKEETANLILTNVMSSNSL